MSPELEICQKAFAALESQRSEILARLAEWPTQKLTFRPSPDAWCAVEVLDHIVRAESGTITDIKNGLKQPHPLGGGERPGVALLDRALRSDKRFRVPAGADSIFPDAQATFPDVLSRWERSRQELRHLVEELTPEGARSAVFQHPFAGWMNLAEVLDHFHAHLYHHTLQLARIEECSAARLEA
jgi:DinB superfamily